MKDAKDQSAFTLIETLVVIAITAILSTMFIIYSNSSTGNLVLYTGRAEVAGVLERAKSLALDKYTSGAYGGTTTCAFGVNFSTSTGEYFIYAVGTSSDSCAGMADYTWGGSPYNYQIQTLQLNGQLAFIPPTSQDIYFVPPYFTANATGTVVIQDTKSGVTAGIEVNAGGSVSSVSTP